MLPHPARNSVAPQPGFSNIINLLLTQPTVDAGEAPDPPLALLPPSPRQNADTRIVDDGIADAMMRSMFAATGTFASASTSRKTGVRFAPEAKAQAASNSQPADGLSLANSSSLTSISPASAPLAPSIGTAREPAAGLGTALGGRGGSKLPAGIVANPGVSRTPSTQPPATLTFGMRLTPADTSETPAETETEQISATPQTPTVSGAASPSASGNASQADSNQAEANQTDANPADVNQAGAPRAPTSEVKSRQESGAQDETEAPVVAIAATPLGSPDLAGDPAREFPSTAPNFTSLPANGRAPAAPAPSATEALRTSEPAAPSRMQNPAPAQQIAVRIAPPQAPSVDVHLTERGGQVHVAVRTADGGLQTALRQDLGTLVSSLERSGFRTETFTPREAIQQASAGAQTNSQNNRQDSESGSSGRNGNPGGTSQNPSHNPGGQQQQRSRDQRSQKWIEELENLK